MLSSSLPKDYFEEVVPALLVFLAMNDEKNLRNERTGKRKVKQKQTLHTLQDYYVSTTKIKSYKSLSKLLYG